MKPSELTTSIVREELKYLIDNNPGRMGSVIVDDCDYTNCVYYTDQNGEAISISDYQVADLDSWDHEVVLKTPVCIVGQWIESFHPEFKDDEVIRDVLFRNHTMRHCNVPFDPDVKLLLTRAQDQQDAGKNWGQIDLDTNTWYA